MKVFAATALIAGASASVLGGYDSKPAHVPSVAPSMPAVPVKSNGTAPYPVYVTEVVTALTTFCPEATKITHNGETYTVTSATTLTITNCPCTVTKATSWYSAPGTQAPTTVPAPVVTSKGYTAPAPYTYSNASTPVAPGKGSPSASYTTSSGPIQATANAASNAFVGAGAALAGVFGAAAYLL